MKIEVVLFEIPWQQDQTDYLAQGLSCSRSLRGANQDNFFLVYIVRTPPVRLHGQLIERFRDEAKVKYAFAAQSFSTSQPCATELNIICLHRS